MTVTSSQQAVIRNVLNLFLGSPYFPSLVPVARRAGAVPVYIDAGGALLIRHDAEVLYVHSNQAWDESATWETCMDEEWRATAFLHASRRFPELEFLFPKRPANAPTCCPCSGSGVVSIAGRNLGCGVCHGLGWKSERTS